MSIQGTETIYKEPNSSCHAIIQMINRRIYQKKKKTIKGHEVLIVFFFLSRHIFWENKLKKIELTGWKRIHNWEDTPYITLMQVPLDISQTLTVLSMDVEAI